MKMYILSQRICKESLEYEIEANSEEEAEEKFSEMLDKDKVEFEVRDSEIYCDIK